MQAPSDKKVDLFYSFTIIPVRDKIRMNELKTIFSHPWSIRLPTVVRYLETKYVDEFFNEGKIRISSFKKFRKYKDEEKGDVFEGRVSMGIEAPNGRYAIAAINGQEAYVLSASTVESNNMKANFQADSGFQIINTLAFADCISRQIPGFDRSTQGFCLYRDSILLQKKTNIPIKPPEPHGNMEEWAAENDRFISEQSVDAYFIKLSKYSHQGEYRFIWFAQGKEEKEHIDLYCPEATKFCERID